MRQATFGELKDLLTSNPMKVLMELGNPDAQLSIPLDGGGLRVLVETHAGKSCEVPTTMCVRIGGEDVEFRLESRDTAQDYVPQDN